MTTIITRRAVLTGAGIAGASLALPGWSRIAFADAPTNKRLVVVILRGALDGLSAVPPIGDASYAGLRGDLAIGADEALKLDGAFGLHPALAGFKARFDAGELAVFHAVAIPVRERSHFEAQAILETGLGRAGGDTGWLNRALTVLGERDPGRSVAFSPSLPLILRGPAAATSYTPSTLPAGSDDFMARVATLYAKDDLLGPALAKGLEVQAIAAGTGAMEPGANAMQGPAQRQNNLVPIAGQAAAMMAREAGPRIAVLEAYGWDTHVGQGGADGQLARRLINLDQAMAVFADGLGPAWRDTVVAIVTEFGRTARPNGSGGTDHGTAAAAFLMGGAVKGGQVIADWPGLKDAQLFEGRDLAPTRDVRGVLKTALAGHLGIAPDRLDGEVFPGSAGAGALDGVIRA